eukprot:713274-Heterocapsa_arctica.AAC.1
MTAPPFVAPPLVRSQEVEVARSSRHEPSAGLKLLIVSYNLIGERKFQTHRGGDFKAVVLD